MPAESLGLVADEGEDQRETGIGDRHQQHRAKHEDGKMRQEIDRSETDHSDEEDRYQHRLAVADHVGKDRQRHAIDQVGQPDGDQQQRQRIVAHAELMDADNRQERQRRPKGQAGRQKRDGRHAHRWRAPYDPESCKHDETLGKGGLAPIFPGDGSTIK
ncbi:MAG: hypothetical protein KL863_26280 [Rhizobium sp.]|nr:hypothetical protein [Rhizobium sp.]